MKFIKYWIPPILWMAVIFYFSSRPSIKASNVLVVQFTIFKILHMLEYGILFILLYRAFRSFDKITLWQNLYQAWFLAIVYGMTDEIHQVFTPTREPAIRDILIDAVGVSITLFVIWKLLPCAPKILKDLARRLELI
jgi:VanZ family protein